MDSACSTDLQFTFSLLLLLHQNFCLKLFGERFRGRAIIMQSITISCRAKLQQLFFFFLERFVLPIAAPEEYGRWQQNSCLSGLSPDCLCMFLPFPPLQFLFFLSYGRTYDRCSEIVTVISRKNPQINRLFIRFIEFFLSSLIPPSFSLSPAFCCDIVILSLLHT